MREILFRGKQNNEWIYGYYCGKMNETIFGPAIDSAEIIDSDLYWHTVNPKTIGQYTGLTDKHEKKIFEGDIIKHYNDIMNPERYEIYEVIFEQRRCMFLGRLHKNYSVELRPELNYQVIGNIYDNPNLLEKRNDK